MPTHTRRSVLAALAALPAFRTLAARAAPAPLPTLLPGTFALAGGTARASATLAATPAPGQAPGRAESRVLDVAMTPLGGSRPVARYDVELGKRLHVIAVDAALTTFVHEHGDRPGTDGHFRVPFAFPHGGTWHVYADATPAGMGQQVFRFGLDLGGGGPGPAALPPPTLPPPALEGTDGPYSVRFDALDLRAGQEAMLPLHVLRDGRPAPDLTPYLGVAAHAVFVSAADLSYVHAHAAPAAGNAAGNAMAGMGMGGMGMGGMGHGAGHAHGTPAPGAAAGARVPPDLVLHLRAPKAGTYRLWVQVMAGGRVRTMPFTVAVA